MSILSKPPAKERAFIKDIKTGKAKLYDVGYEIDEYILMSIDPTDESVQLKKGDADPVKIKKTKPQK